MVRAFGFISLFVVCAAIGALFVNCTAGQQATALDLGKDLCVVIDHVPAGSQMYVLVQAPKDAGVHE